MFDAVQYHLSESPGGSQQELDEYREALTPSVALSLAEEDGWSVWMVGIYHSSAPS